MSTQPLHLAEAIGQHRPQTRAASRPLGGLKFDWAMILLAAWFLGGLYLDGWAHTHGKVDQSFFTPWHAVLYSGQFAVTIFLAVHWRRNRNRGYGWRQALPAGYEMSFLGGLLWFPAGVA